MKFLVASLALISLVAIAVTTSVSAGKTPTTDAVEQAANDTAALFRAARLVISDSQAHINDASLGDKGLTGAIVIQRTKENYAKAVGQVLPEIDDSLFGRVQKAMYESIEAVMEEAQPLINEQGKSFKGFLPAVFGKRLADRFGRAMGGSVAIKLTAPKEYVRNRSNRPDEWENNVIETKFRAKEWTRGVAFGENADLKGKRAYRLMIPEYYGASCLTCHGTPKGELDITGGKKEGAKLDELGGSISVTIYQ